MEMKTLTSLAAGILAGLMFTGTAQAANILCQNEDNNHMLIDDSVVSACLDAGPGNLTGNPKNDLFLDGVGGDYEFIEKFEDPPFTTGGFTQTGNTGTFFFDTSLWDTFSSIAIGFKFGTGNQPDEWFVYAMQPLTSAGPWEFVNVHGRGGGLSHVNLYGIRGDASVPEPTTLGLLGLGLLGLAVIARRRLARA